MDPSRADESGVVILRDPAGKPLHAVLNWHRYEALLRAAEAPGRHVGDQPAQGAADVARRQAEGVSAVRAWREHRGFSQAQLAALTGISRAYLTQIETGERTGTVEVMARIARNLDCRIEDLVRIAGDDFASAVAALARMPARVQALVAAVPERHWRARPDAGGFSLLEHICHLRDIDQDGYRVRIARMLDEDVPALADLDGERLARDRDYQRQDLGGALGGFTEARVEIVRRLRGLTPAERERKGQLEGAGLVTIDALVAAMLAHDSGHADELAALGEALAKI